jgi:hypothetical protein
MHTFVNINSGWKPLPQPRIPVEAASSRDIKNRIKQQVEDEQIR